MAHDQDPPGTEPLPGIDTKVSVTATAEVTKAADIKKDDNDG
jgi:hypothetical protein